MNPQGKFLRQPLMLWLFPYFLALHTLQNSHMEALCLWKNLRSWKNQKQKKVLSKKKKRKKKQNKTKQAQIRQNEYHSIKKQKNSLQKQLVLVELHAGVQISNKELTVKPRFAMRNIKNNVSLS